MSFGAFWDGFLVVFGLVFLMCRGDMCARREKLKTSKTYLFFNDFKGSRVELQGFLVRFFLFFLWRVCGRRFGGSWAPSWVHSVANLCCPGVIFQPWG